MLFVLAQNIEVHEGGHVASVSELGVFYLQRSIPTTY